VGRGPEEVQALSDRTALEELASYLDNAERLVGASLTLMDPSGSGGERESIKIARAMAEAEVNRYESENASARMGAET